MSPAFILLLVTQDDGRALPTATIQRALVEVVGAITVLTEEAPRTLLDEVAAERGRELRLTAVYQIVWKQLDPPALEVRAWIRDDATEGNWIIRRLDFASGDSPVEIARAIGYAAAAMLPQSARRAPARTEMSPDGDGHVAANSLSIEGTAAQNRPAHAFLVDLSGSAGLSDNGNLAWGGGLRLSWTATSWLRPTAAAVASTESFDAAQIRASRLGLCVGGVLTLLTSTRASLALRAEAEAVLEIATRFSQAQGQTVQQSRWLPAFNPALEAAIAVSSGTAVIVSGGYEVAVGKTDLYVGGVKTATLPSARANTAIGVRMTF